VAAMQYSSRRLPRAWSQPSTVMLQAAAKTHGYHNSPLPKNCTGEPLHRTTSLAAPGSQQDQMIVKEPTRLVAKIAAQIIRAWRY